MKQIKDEGIRNPEKYTVPQIITKEFCLEEIQFILQKIHQGIDIFTHRFPTPSSIKNIYPAIDNTDWTSAFWTGMLWLAYEVTDDEKYRRIAELQLKSYRRRLEERICTDTHDLGFLYSLSCVAAYRLTGSEEARDLAIKAADLLMERYFDKAGIIQAWGELADAGNRGRMIIDCCMNLPLLYWASQATGQGKYRQAAASHARQAMNHIIREDASSYHTFYIDVETGEPKYGRTAQGYSDSSCWSRGQAWGIYGFVLSYIYTKDWHTMEMAKRMTNYFLNRLPEDHICYWDLIFTGGTEERDSSAAAIAACGMLEMVKHLPLTDNFKRLYEGASMSIIGSLARSYTSRNCPQSNGILLHGVYSKPGGLGVDECNIWGDYFYFEALVRLMKDWKPYW